MKKNIVRLNESQLYSIIEKSIKKTMKENRFDPYDPEAKEWQKDISWHALESGLIDGQDAAAMKSSNDAEKRFYSTKIDGKPNSWGTMAIDEPTNVRDDHGQISMIAQGDQNDYATKLARSKRDTLRHSREAEYRDDLDEGKLNKIVSETVEKVLNEVKKQPKTGTIEWDDDYASTGDPYNLIDEPMDEPSMDGYYAFSNIYVDIKGDGTDNPCIEIFSRRYGDRKKICGQQAVSILKNIENDIEDCGGFYQAIYKNTCRYVS